MDEVGGHLEPETATDVRGQHFLMYDIIMSIIVIIVIIVVDIVIISNRLF